ncbi:hypothetical protein EB820_21010 [Brevibacillus agri]|uniref:Uncharacterized protein n=1 Tax=Brevibacillus agri TaxID=51101 RepID=A0A3M8AKM9_9BACL|nr:hypothetical protein EB820_21010 [Brevibacillus agri]
MASEKLQPNDKGQVAWDMFVGEVRFCGNGRRGKQDSKAVARQQRSNASTSQLIKKALARLASVQRSWPSRT